MCRTVVFSFVDLHHGLPRVWESLATEVQPHEKIYIYLECVIILTRVISLSTSMIFGVRLLLWTFTKIRRDCIFKASLVNLL